MDTTFAYGQVEHIVEKFLHPAKRDILPCVKISNQTFNIVAIAYRGIGLLGETTCGLVPTSTFAAIYLVLGYMEFDFGNIDYLAFPCRNKWDSAQVFPATTTKAGDMVFNKVWGCNHFERIAFMPGLPSWFAP